MEFHRLEAIGSRMIPFSTVREPVVLKELGHHLQSKRLGEKRER